MKKIGKIILAILSLCSFLWLAFCIAMYYINGLVHLYYTKNVVIGICVCCAILLFLLAVVIAFIAMMFKPKETIRVIATILLVLLIPVSLVGSFVSLAITMYADPYGCSYTEDIANYGKYDWDHKPLHFPESITQDMTVVDFRYYYKYTCKHPNNPYHQRDYYLEVKFDDRETMDKYLTEAKKAIYGEGVVEYQNPYDSKYTDAIGWHKSSDDQKVYYDNYVSFGDDEGYRYVDIWYSAVIYSYQELTIIYNDTSIGSDIMVGNNPHKGQYYPKILERFGVEWNKDGGFKSSDIVEYTKG